MAEVNHGLLGTLGVVGAGFVIGDYFINGPKSIIGKLLGHHKHHHRHFPKWHHRIPSDPLHGENKWGQTSVGNTTPGWVFPVETARAPFPAILPDTSGRVKIPIDKGGSSWFEAQEVAAESIANLVFQDTTFLTSDHHVGTSVEIRNNILEILRSPHPPELFRRLVEFHHRHGPAALDRGSPLHNQQIEMAGACADLYENYVGVEKWFSREGNAYAAEYDDLNDRLAAAGAKSPIVFNIGGAYYFQ